MRSALAALLFLAAFSLPTRAADVELVRVFHGWREADSFERISEFFTGRERTGRDPILRSQPEERAGYYFLARIKNSGGAVSNAKFLLRIIAPNDPQTKTFAFPVSVGKGTHVFNLGLTGSDWLDPKSQLVAWKLELVQGDGQVLAAAKSFLWEKPAQ